MPFGLKQVLIAITPLLYWKWMDLGTSWVIFSSHRYKVNVVVQIESLAHFLWELEALPELESHRSLIKFNHPSSHFRYA